MPTILRKDKFRFYFYSHEPNEPPHVHIDAAEKSAKFWLCPTNLASNHGFSASELSAILRIVEDNQRLLMEAWHDHFGNTE